ncbi:alpha/beta fold hydrolase [Litoreibacter arenae]|uniref:alpha/beta fold hydrolase n=1 Tax=Litoreibacter arenae TaxID=491388 RepID=UPI001B804536|nr:alpha/beta fold hydrolase [Litoreibacter arenae]
MFETDAAMVGHAQRKLEVAMTLFFSRRALNTKTNTFTNNMSSLTRYVSVQGQRPDGKWSSHLLDRDAFVAATQAEAQSDDVLIYVHGFNTRQRDMLARHKLIEDGLRAEGYRGAVISFDWPSRGKSTSYARDLRMAGKVGKYLVEGGVLPLLDSTWKPRVHLICHSMGAFITLDGFARFGDSSGPGSGAWKVDEILFAAGDAHRRDFEKGAAGALVLRHHSKRLTNYYSNDDEVLTLAFAYHGKPRVGLSGMPDLVFAEHVDLYATERYRHIKPTFPDDTEAQLFSHRWWFEDARFLKDAALTLAGGAAGALPTRTRTNLGTLALKP